MQKWNLLKKTAPCILSLAVAATSFPTAVMATDFDTAVVSEAEAQEADVEDFGAEEVEAAEDTTEEMTEDIQQDEAADDLEIQEDAVAEEADPVSDGEDEFSAGDDTEEAFSDESQLKGEYQYVYAGLTWGEYWAAEGVYNAGNTSSSDELDLKDEADKGAFDTVTRATANHGLHRGSYQTEATIIATDGTKFAVSYWKDNQTIVLTDGSEATWNRGFLTKDGKEYEMDHYEVYGLKYVPVAVKTADYADFCKKYNVVNAGETISGGYGEMNLQSYVGLVADVTADTNGLKYAEKNGDSFTFTARKSNGTTSGIKGQALKTATDVEPTVKTADGSYGEFLRVDINGNYGDLGANMQAVRWDYYGDDSTYTTKPLASYGTKFAADNWMHKKMGIQLGLTKSARCKLPGGTDGTGYWKLTVYALGYNDYTYKFQATTENIVEPQVEPTDFTDLKAEVETAKALKQADYTVATWKSFAGELAEAEEVIAKTDASQAEVNEALSHLQAAEKELVKVTAALDKKTAAVYTGKTVTLKATSNDKDAKATFTSSNTKVATVSSTGVVKGVKAGTATITASYGNAKATCKVTVKASTIKFAKASVTIYKGKTATVKATATPSATVKYTSSNTKVATVNSKTGVVKGIKAGTVTITAKAGALKTTCKVVVKNPAFSLVKSSATIKKGKTTTIRSKAAPAGKVTYTSSNKKVAAVNSKGVVKGIKKGKATITVKCNGITKKFVVTVK